MVKVKICGITNIEDARASVASGCDALGFIFFKKSPRYIYYKKARRIISELPSRIVKIGVFVNSREKTIKRIAKECNLDMLQFHGDESPSFCRRFAGYKIIKTFRIKNTFDLKRIYQYCPFAFLFDTFSGSKLGGTGKKFNWKLVQHLEHIKRPIFLSGGLTKENVKEAIRTVHPDWVDVCSSVEIRPGKKSHPAIKAFVKSAKEA